MVLRENNVGEYILERGVHHVSQFGDHLAPAPAARQ